MHFDSPPAFFGLTDLFWTARRLLRGTIRRAARTTVVVDAFFRFHTLRSACSETVIFAPRADRGSSDKSQSQTRPDVTGQIQLYGHSPP
eukprot:6262151-Prymnesium_polylepis.3